MGITPERKLKKAKIDVMRSTLPGLRLWAGIMSIGKTSLCDKTPTAYTNGRDEVYGTAMDLARRLARGPALAMRAAKRAIDGGIETDLWTNWGKRMAGEQGITFEEWKVKALEGVPLSTPAEVSVSPAGRVPLVSE